jgi:Tol biopolymer transport system component
MPPMEPGEAPIRWSPDGRSVILAKGDKAKVRISHLDLATGRREVVKELTPADPAGVVEISGGAVTPDGKTYVYGDRRILSDLYVVDGVR